MIRKCFIYIMVRKCFTYSVPHIESIFLYITRSHGKLKHDIIARYEFKHSRAFYVWLAICFSLVTRYTKVNILNSNMLCDNVDQPANANITLN